MIKILLTIAILGGVLAKNLENYAAIQPIPKIKNFTDELPDPFGRKMGFGGIPGKKPGLKVRFAQ